MTEIPDTSEIETITCCSLATVLCVETVEVQPEMDNNANLSEYNHYANKLFRGTTNLSLAINSFMNIGYSLQIITEYLHFGIEE